MEALAKKARDPTAQACFCLYSELRFVIKNFRLYGNSEKDRNLVPETGLEPAPRN